MIFQDPMSSLHPFYRIGDQIVEAIGAHRECPQADAREEALDMLGGLAFRPPSGASMPTPMSFPAACASG